MITQKFLEELTQQIKNEHPNVNMMLVLSDEDTPSCVTLNGKLHKLSLSLFAALCNDNNPQIAQNICSILKDVVFNATQNNYKMAEDLTQAILYITDRYKNQQKKTQRIIGEA